MPSLILNPRVIRVVYIAGKYRHYNFDGSLAYPAMSAEVEDEKKWSELVWTSGNMPVAPLCNSVHMEGHPSIAPDSYIDADLALIRRLRGGHDCILMRPGWRTSIGATRERECALNMGLIVLDGDQMPPAEISAYLSAPKEA